MKKWIAISLLVVLLLASAAPALAMRGQPTGAGGWARGGRNVFTVAGVITSIDSAAKTVNISVAASNRFAKSLIGQEVTVQTGAATRFLQKTSSGTLVVSFDELAVGQNVSVQGTVSNNIYTARHITIGAMLKHLP